MCDVPWLLQAASSASSAATCSATTASRPPTRCVAAHRRACASAPADRPRRARRASTSCTAKSKGNYGNSVPTLDKQAGTYLGPDATSAHKHFFNDKRRRATRARARAPAALHASRPAAAQQRAHVTTHTVPPGCPSPRRALDAQPRLPLGLDEAALGRQLHSALWGRRALWKDAAHADLPSPRSHAAASTAPRPPLARHQAATVAGNAWSRRLRGRSHSRDEPHRLPDPTTHEERARERLRFRSHFFCNSDPPPPPLSLPGFCPKTPPS